MFTEKDILTRLQNGEDAQKIAEEMTSILNAANKAYAQEKEKNTVKQRKVNDMKVLLNMMSTYLNTYYPNYNEIVEEVFEEFDAEELVNYVDETFAGFDELASLLGDMFKPNAKKSDSNEKLNKDLKQMHKRAVDADKVLEDFLENAKW